MLVKYTYPIKTNLSLEEHWPVEIDGIKIAWEISDGRISKLIATISATATDELPAFKSSGNPNIAAELSMPPASRQEEVNSAVRTIRGLLNHFGVIEVDISQVKTDWIPENEEDRKKLNIFSFSASRQKYDIEKRLPIDFEMISRCVLSAKDAARYEIPLEFYRRGSNDIREEQYISAIYNLFFFLETQFAPGYSKKTLVKQKLKETAIVLKNIDSVRHANRNSSATSSRKKLLLLKSNEELIDHFVDLRGNLHHHALGRKDRWHPDKAHEFEDDAKLLFEIIHKIAFDASLELLYSEDCNQKLKLTAERENIFVSLRIESSGITESKEVTFSPIVVRVPGQVVNITKIDIAHRIFRDHLQKEFKKGIEILEYRIMSEDRSRIYATWERKK